MNVEMPDGTIIEDVPDGITKAELLRRYKKTTQPANDSAPVPNVAAEAAGPVDAAIIGAGRTLDRWGKGLTQGALWLSSKFPYGAEISGQIANEQKRMADTEAENTRLYGQLQEKRPIATFIGEAVPLLAALPATGSVTGAAALGAAPGLIEYGTGEEKLYRGALGAAGGAVGATAGKVLGRVVQPIRGASTESQQAARDAAERLGVKLRADELTGSRPLGWLQSNLADLPFSGGMARRVDDARKAALNTAAAKSIGQNASDLTEQTLANARDTIGTTFRNILDPLRVHLDKQFQADVAKISGSKVLKELRDDSIEALIDPFKNLPGSNVRVAGDWFQQNKTALDAAIRTAYNTGQSGKARALEQFESALDRAATRSMGAAEKRAYEVARKQWANLRLLETQQVVEAGNVVPSRVDAALRNRYKHAYKEGRLSGELVDIGRLAQSFKALPQSGTTPRALYSNVGLGLGATLGDPVTGAAVLAAPALAQKFLQSDMGRAYLSKGMAQITPEMERRLMMGGAGLLGLPAITFAGQ